ncbi:MAG TPA: transposase [Bacillota bacterium]
MQTITLRLGLHRPTIAKQRLYSELTARTTALANNLVTAGRPKGLSSMTAASYLSSPIPAAVLNQALRDVQAAKKVKRFRVLPPSFNNQNLSLKRVGDFWTASFPTHEGRVRVPLTVTDRQSTHLEKLGSTVKQGAAKLYAKRGRWYLALSITVQVTPCVGTKVAGIDLGLRNLAVAVCGNETLFFSGDHAAYVRRRFSALRTRMGKAKALSAIRRMKGKEAHWMRDLDHKISREIVNWCLARGVSTIRMEDLSGIRFRHQRDRKDRGRSLHSWAFRQLQRFIAYKAILAGMKVEWVIPANTSRACPECGVVDESNRNGIVFLCRHCSHKEHADVVGGKNISKAISGLAKAS